MIYAAMCERLDVGENEDPEQVRRRFDVDLAVRRWKVTDHDPDPYADAVIEPGAPWWWEGDEEASASTLAALGVSL